MRTLLRPLLFLALLSSVVHGAASAQTVASRDLQALERSLGTAVREWLEAGELARENGYTYTVDLGQLLLYFAGEGDRDTYARLRRLVTDHVLLDDPSTPYTRGFVAWRYRDGEPLDASGTTEALRVAEGLWAGAARFGDARDRELALLTLDGYARHAFEEGGIWYIRNYYNLGTGAFSINSFMVDYDPDFVSQVAEAVGDRALGGLAERSYALLARAQTPAGLLYDLIQPEVLTLAPVLDQPIFSPNDIIHLANSCTVAETVAEGRPELGRAVLDFAFERLETLGGYYYGRTGEAADPQEATISDYTCLVRLATRLSDPRATGRLLELAYGHWQTFERERFEPRLYTASEVLLTLQVLRGASPLQP